ncbi:endonuclease/exonuclease/phosphatase family protein [Streptomyces sp. ITFR-16]|uniref:endonuclease/exonuclease/phosphatase family protein n=1 Tax=Streptomyces sp. ITFR-16 TaxID=3075198 RepID=UPI00288C01F9|nr:endonuclease/exonuclease/phosphatase family protein [Streptomyces sp. ITFR-16]WNI26476.1 endonuclease/exonuclease/phosphatase family protein [Streptomyces sp. ITFR-16]
MTGTGVRWLAGVLIVACVLVAGPSAPGGFHIAKPLPADAPQEAVPNRVMTWNICNPCKGRSQNAGRAAEIASYAPQVIGLQEACVGDVERIREQLRYLYGLVYHVEYGSVLKRWSRCGGVPWSPGGFGQAILSAAPMTDRVNVEYPDGGSEDRGYMAVTTLVDGRPVRVFNTHLAQFGQASVRAKQTGVLAKAVARYDRTIVLGDFNAVPDAPELAGMWGLATDADAGCGPSAAGACEPTTDWRSKFDYIFLRGFTPLGQRVHLTPYSDHDLVQADLRRS